MHARYSALAKTGQVVLTNALSMTLNGAVDAPAGGGISLFRQAFLSPEYLVQNPDRADQVQKLRDAIDEQACLAFNSLFAWELISLSRSA